MEDTSNGGHWKRWPPSEPSNLLMITAQNANPLPYWLQTAIDNFGLPGLLIILVAISGLVIAIGKNRSRKSVTKRILESPGFGGSVYGLPVIFQNESAPQFTIRKVVMMAECGTEFELKFSGRIETIEPQERSRVETTRVIAGNSMFGEIASETCTLGTHSAGTWLLPNLWCKDLENRPVSGWAVADYEKSDGTRVILKTPFSQKSMVEFKREWDRHSEQVCHNPVLERFNSGSEG